MKQASSDKNETVSVKYEGNQSWKKQVRSFEEN